MISKLLMLVCLLLAFHLKAQETAGMYKHLNVSDGLSSNNVKCIYKDSRGFLWIGTDKGLNRFDGRNVKTYIHHSGDSASLGNNEINAVCEGEKGTIWVATMGGISAL